jgi:hypothetical protein
MVLIPPHKKIVMKPHIKKKKKMSEVAKVLQEL